MTAPSSDGGGRRAPIGIDHIAGFVPNQYLPLEALAEARDVPVGKYHVGIGIREMAVPAPCEDVVVLAANAGRQVLEEAGVSPGDIGFLVVGTESAEDKSKPTATHVHGLLGVGSECRVYDVIHACIGATYGLLSAIDWINGGDERKYALVIASDIAKYGLATPGEATQGAGAVAMLISRNPRLMTLHEIGTFSENVYDFWKPMNQEFPIVKGVYSTECYQKAVGACFNGQEIDGRSAFLYHTPYPGIIRQAHARVMEIIHGSADSKAHFESNVASSTVLASRVGNIYTGSLWLALLSLLGHQRNPPLQWAEADRTSTAASSEGMSHCYLFSYGSGCGAALMRGRFESSALVEAKTAALVDRLDARTSLSIDEYEKLMYATGPVDWPPSPHGYFRFDGVRDDERVYSSIR